MKEYPKSNLNRVKRGASRATYDFEKINDILDAGFLGYVAYTYDGKSISIPMAYGRKDDVIFLHGSTGNRLLRSLLDHGKISMTVTHLDGLVLARSGFHHSVNYRSATLFGMAVQVEDDQEKIDALKVVVDQMIPGRWEELRTMTQKELDRTLVVKMVIETASAKVRAEGVVDEEEDHTLPIWAGVVPLKQVAELPISDEALPEGVEVPEHVMVYYGRNKLS